MNTRAQVSRLRPYSPKLPQSEDEMNPERATPRRNRELMAQESIVIADPQKQKPINYQNEEIGQLRKKNREEQKSESKLSNTREIHEEQYVEQNNEEEISEFRRKRKNNFPLHIVPTENERLTNERRNELEVAKQIISGKISIIWIFIIQGKLQNGEEVRIRSIYNGLSEKKYLVPICKNIVQAEEFLGVPNSIFKIVTDLASILSVMKLLDNPKVVQFYIFNEKGERGVAEALAYKSRTEKIKAIFTRLGTIVDRAESEIQSQIQMFKAQDGISTRKFQKIFPSFLKLSGEDKTNATQYRANLYGSRNMSPDQREFHYKDFMDYVQEKYGSEEKQKKNIIQYSSLDHFGEELRISLAKQVIKFYVRQSFYYKILNSMLRVMKTTEEFKPCVFPFYQTYHAIKMIYMDELTSHQRKIEPQTLYRGAKLRPKDFQSLIPGTYIEMYGFMSTSKAIAKAKEFTDRKGHIFVIHIPKMQIKIKNDKYDHGFIDINKHSLAPKNFEVQEEVLFNALNIFKVLEIEEKDGFKLIHLEYGSIFFLLSKEKSSLTTDEKDVLINYQYCANMLNQITDQGDVYLFNNQVESSKLFYQQKINQGEKGDKYFHKLANIQQQCGQIQQANKNIKKALEFQKQIIATADRETCLKVFSIHSKRAEISIENEDYLTADDAINDSLQLLSEDQLFEKAKKLRERGEIKFKKGEIRNSELDFQKSEEILNQLSVINEAEMNKSNHGFFYFIEKLICGNDIQDEIEQQQRKKKMQEIALLEKEIINIKNQISEELIKVNDSMKEVALFADDKFKYEICVQKARGYLLELKCQQTNDPREKSRLLALQATVQTYLDLAESEKLLNEAIQLIEADSPFDSDVGKYATLLAKIQKDELNQFSAKGIKGVKLEKGMKQIEYNEKEQQEVYERCRQNFQKAINVLLHNNQKHSSPEVMKLKNQIGQLDFNEANYVKSEKIIRQVKAASLDSKHSEVAKSCLLLSKICYARGQLTNAFENVSESEIILKKAILKNQEQKYRIIYERHELYRDLLVHRSKIYMQQLNHDMSMRDILSLQEIFRKRIEDSESQSVMADLYELLAENLILQRNDSFSQAFDRAIQLRQKQMGSFNLHNGITYCNYAKYMILNGDMLKAQQLLEKAFEIFSCFAKDHPITWLVFYCIGIYKEGKNQIEQALSSISTSIQIAENKFDKDHITLCKIKFQFGRVLVKAKKHDKALKCFLSLESYLSEKLNESLKSNIHKREGDDEKVGLYRLVYQKILKCEQEDKIQESIILKSKKEEVELKMSNLKKMIAFEDENETPN